MMFSWRTPVFNLCVPGKDIRQFIVFRKHKWPIPNKLASVPVRQLKRFQYLGKGMRNHKIEIPIKKRTAEQCGAFFVELK